MIRSNGFKRYDQNTDNDEFKEHNSGKNDTSKENIATRPNSNIRNGNIDTTDHDVLFHHVADSINKKNEIIEECFIHSSTNCDCCNGGGNNIQKSFLPIFMLQNYNNHNSLSSSTTTAKVVEPSPPQPINIPSQQHQQPKQTSDTNVTNTECRTDTSILFLDTSSDGDLDDHDDDNNNNNTLTSMNQINVKNVSTPTTKSLNHYENLDSSPEVEWNGSLIDHDISFEDNNNNKKNRKHENLSNFIASSDESDSAEENDDEFDDEVEWHDSDGDDDDDSSSSSDDEINDSRSVRPRRPNTETFLPPKPSIEDDLIQRTNEILILNSSDDDDEDDDNDSSSKTTTTKFPPRENTSICQQASTKGRKSVVESKVMFRKRRMVLSQQLLIYFDQKAFGSQLLVKSTMNDVDRPTLTLTWSNKLRTTAGLTRLSRVRQFLSTQTHPVMDHTTSNNAVERVTRIAAIELSCKVIDDEHRLRSTLLHEMCHAAAWLVDDTEKPAHGLCFRNWAKRASDAIPDIIVTTTHNYEIDFKYKWVCVNYPNMCNVIVQRHSRSIDVERQICGRCKGRLREVQKGETIKSSSSSTTDVGGKEARKKRAAVVPLSAYNEFIRDHAPLVRRRLMATSNGGTTKGKVLQSDVMKECARLWKERTTVHEK